MRQKSQMRIKAIEIFRRYQRFYMYLTGKFVGHGSTRINDRGVEVSLPCTGSDDVINRWKRRHRAFRLGDSTIPVNCPFTETSCKRLGGLCDEHHPNHPYQASRVTDA